MKLLRSAALGAVLAVLGAGAALAADCCDGKAPCCEKKDDKGQPMPCCDKHKAEAPKTETPAPDAPKPAPEHDHRH
jgi:hypothetical protein